MGDKLNLSHARLRIGDIMNRNCSMRLAKSCLKFATLGTLIWSLTGCGAATTGTAAAGSGSQAGNEECVAVDEIYYQNARDLELAANVMVTGEISGIKYLNDSTYP